MKILFISHDASRSGGPILLRNFMSWILKNTSHEFSCILRVGGVIESDFYSLCDCDKFYPKYYNNYKSFFQKILNRLGFFKFKLERHQNRLLKKYLKQNFDLIYSNTIVNVDVLNLLKELNIPIISHVRELESTIQHFGGNDQIEKLNTLSTLFIADSYAVKENLIETHGVDTNKIKVVHEYVEIPDKLPTKETTVKLQKELDIPENSFIIGASGGGLWRKGYDLFIQTAIATCKKPGNENVYFIWVGGFKKKKEYELNYDLEKSGLKDKIKFVGAQKNPLDYFSLFDVFFLSSREEPFGIVGMESALFETPVICFDNSGGMPEFVKDHCGLSIPYLDIPKLVEGIMFFKNNPSIKQEYGSNAKNKVMKEHTLEIKSKEIIKIMNTVQ